MTLHDLAGHFHTGCSWCSRFALGLVFAAVAGGGVAGCASDFPIAPSAPVPEWRPNGTAYFAGIPRGGMVRVLASEGFVVGYSEAEREPLWVCYRLFKVDDPVSLGRIERFAVDERTESRVSHDDYTGTGFDRGHMAPSAGIAKCYGEAGWRRTYVMSNIVPQRPGLNQRVWEAFERLESEKYAETLGEVWVITGPIFEGPCEQMVSSKGETGVHVPSSFFKILATYHSGAAEVLAIEMKQTDRDPAPVRAFVRTVDEIERRTGFDFFADLPDGVESRVEASAPAALWEIQTELRPTFPGLDRALRTVPCR